MNLSAINNNATTDPNAAPSGVLPPRMKDISLWLSSDNCDISRYGNVKTMADMSGRGNHLTGQDSSMSNDLPTHGISDIYDSAGVTANFNGKRVAKFRGPVDNATHIRGTGLDFENIFGSSGSYTNDPTWTIGGVVAQHADGDASEKLFLLRNTSGTIDKFVLMRHSTGARWAIKGSNGINQYGSGTDWLEKAQTFLFTVIDPSGSASDDMVLKMWKAGLTVTWDTDSTQTESDTTYEMGDPIVSLEDPSQFYISAAVNSGEGWYGDFGEVILWKGSFSDAEAIEATNYLSTKWGCA